MSHERLGEPGAVVVAERHSWWDRATVWWGGQPPRTPRQRARVRAIRRGVVAAIVLVVIGSMLKIPLLVLGPGPTYNVTGEVNGQPLIMISGTQTYPTDGALDMTTVAERGGSSGGVYLGEALVGWASTGRKVVPREAIYGTDVSGEEVATRNDQLFALSQSNSIAAAMDELGLPTEQSLVVTLVSSGSPADGIVQAGDEVVSVDGEEVTRPGDVGQMVRQREAGDPVTLGVLRQEGPESEPEPLDLEIVTEARPDPPAGPEQSQDDPYVGIVIGTAYQAPFDIEFGDSNVAGPSAGMMFSLGIIDILTEQSLTDGRHVAGSGTIDPEGTVGAIGSIRQKLVGAARAGAELFLAPRDNCDEVVGHVPDGLTVVPVADLAAARDMVQQWVADPEGQLPRCDQLVAAAAR